MASISIPARWPGGISSTTATSTTRCCPSRRRRTPTRSSIATGASFGAYHAACFGFRHPHLVNRIVGMSGLYDMKRLTGGLLGRQRLCLQPIGFHAARAGPGAARGVPAAGHHSGHRPGRPVLREQPAPVRGAVGKGIGNALRIWDGWAHDWPYWERMIRQYIGGTTEGEAHMTTNASGSWSGGNGPSPRRSSRKSAGAQAGVTAEFVKVGAANMDEVPPYDVIIDRISHEVPYYRSYLKHAVLQGVTVVNNPFMWTADDKFFGATLASRSSASPARRRVALPNKDYVPGIVHEREPAQPRVPARLEGDRRATSGCPAFSRTRTAAAGRRSTSATPRRS